MKSYIDVREYLSDLSTNSAPALLPIQMIADHRDAARATIERMIKQEQLTGVTVGKGKFVDARSLLILEEEERTKVAKVRKYLEECGGAGVRSIFYDSVMGIIGLKTDIPYDRKIIGEILGDISKDTWNEAGILLSVIVHKKTSGKTRPGSGFFTLANELKCPGRNNEQRFIETQTTAVLKYYANR